jgi:predicted phage terminase large subunit-like protein
MKNRRPRFAMIVQTVDTPLKDKQVNDMVAIQAWGVTGADRYLLDLKKGHMSKGQAYRAIIEQANYVRDRSVFGPASYHVLIENAGYGVELINELKRVLTGVLKLTRAHEGDKELRAEAAAAGLESGNHFLPGYREGGGDLSMPRDDLNAAEITDFIDSCAGFPNARFDDDVDAWSQVMNWLSTKVVRPARSYSSFKAA